MPSLCKLVVISILAITLIGWIAFSVGAVVTYTESSKLVLNMTNSSASKFVLPLFIPHLIAGVSFPITIGAALIELCLSRERMDRIYLWTTTVVSTGSTVYLLAAGPTAFITAAGLFALYYFNDALTSKSLLSVNSDSNFIIVILLNSYHYSSNDLLWIGNIVAMVGILIITVLYMAHLCYWPHTLKPKENQYFVAQVDLLNVSTAIVE